jgi:AcrR family transcriptional regulator
MDDATGLRARKKEQTRAAIAEAARCLFSERGFDAVTVNEVARAANVSPGTVFNYFPTKEDLFYSQMEAFEASLVDAVREREAGESVLSTFRRVIMDGSVRLAREEVAEVIATAARVVSGSTALQAREREIVAQATRTLATLFAEERGTDADDVEAAVVANALIGVQGALRVYVHAEVLAGRTGPRLAAEVRWRGERAFERLERGLGDYAIKSD